jgi:multicomponent Na+:H+ antiporter subunit G
MYFGYFLVCLGAFMVLTGSIGIFRFPDFYSRLHPAGITDSFAAPLMLIGMILAYSPPFLVVAKILLIIIFLWATSATACYILAEAAYKNKVASSDELSND